MGARLHSTATQISRRRTTAPAQANQLYTFLWGQLYNGKIAHRYGKQPTTACRLCGLPDSCTHIAGTCPANTAHIIKKHNAAVQLVHAPIRSASKGGAALHRAPLTLLCCDAGTTAQTTPAQLHALSHPQENTQPPEMDKSIAHLIDHIDTTLFAPTWTQHGYVDVSTDTNACLSHTQSQMSDSDAETSAAPCHIPPWILSESVTTALRNSGHGVSPDLIYARGVLNSLRTHTITFEKQQCSLLLVEVGFGADLNLKRKTEEKTTKYQPLIQALS